ncbi:MMPL family transporter [Georgenia sp. SYP-B2076]|uniref:MMPL family transporter n=1 Tax=Georgenia sp. SYP-B2076 TaxID=2495881 RepID=UPI000F8C9ADB|nr:MMPL family transporter [Georgenia sp. SYP-B2076]
MFDLLGRAVARHPRTIVGVWAVLALLCGLGSLTGFGGQGLFDRLHTGEPSVPGSESDAGRDILAGVGDTPDQISLLVQGTDLADPAVAADVATALEPAHAGLAEIDGVDTVVDPFLLPDMLASPAAAGLVSAAEDGFLMVVVLEDNLDDDAQGAAHAAVVDRLRQVPADLAGVAPGASGIASSGTLIGQSIVDQVREDLVTGEMVALPVALVIMVLVFGGFLAAGLPLLGALVSIVGGLGVLLALSYVMNVDSFVVNVITVIGLALSIDYGLLVVSRYREELHRLAAGADGVVDAGSPAAGLPTRRVRLRRRARRDPLVAEAVRATVATAGRTVIFSAITVALAITGLLLMRPEVLRSIAAAGIAAVLFAVASAITLVPAVITLLGGRLGRPSSLTRVPALRRLVGALGDVAPRDGFFSALARRVHAHPWVVLVGTLAVLVLLASPVTGLSMRSSGTEILPTESDQRDYIAVLAEDYPASATADLTVVTDASPAEATAWSQEVADLPGVERVDPPVAAGDHTVLGVFLDAADPAGAEATAVVEAVRALDPPFGTWVVGQAASQLDFNDSLVNGLPAAGAVVVVAIFVLLFLMTGSVLVPVKALLVNLLSLTASLGVTVWIFQEGHGAGLLGFTPVAGLESYVVAIAVAFGFGLAMDYEVFLLSRIKEYWDAGLSNDEAVERGLQRSGRIITSAALIMVAVFAGFVSGDLIVIKEVGVALAVTVLVDATLVRMLLVPATMTLLGRWNWWAPAPMRRMYERFKLVH